MDVSCSTTSHWTDATSCSSPAAGALFFTSFITTLLQSERDLQGSHPYPEDASPYLLDEYDFIIVGGGTAGSIVAARLSEVADWNVLVVEAGGDPPLVTNIPALFGLNQKTEIDWQFRTEPQDDNCLGFKDRQCNVPRGKVLGGTGTIHGMFYYRGMRADFEEWAAAGNDGWSYEEVLKYFKKAENFKPTEGENSDITNYGKGGPLTVQRLETLDYGRTLLAACKEAGHEILDDINGPSQRGYARLHATIQNGSRWSTVKAYLNPVRERRNLHVAKHSQVTKIIIDPATKAANKVEIKTNDGKLHQIKTRKEVIVSAGTMHSPQVLMLSGIGPEEHLKEFGIETISNLKVGENLQDHPMYLGLTFTITKSEDFQADSLSFLDASYEYLTRRTGFFATHYGPGVGGFIKTNSSPDDRPDVLTVSFVFLANDTAASTAFVQGMDLNEEIFQSLKEMSREGDVVMLVPLLARPRTKGKILLSSSNPSDLPKIHAGFLTNPKDIDVMIEATETLSNLMQTDVMKKRNAKRTKLFVKACEKYEFESREYSDCMLRHVSTYGFHPVGTCKMGPSSDPDAVVGPQLKVHGVDGIRVVDASIMPHIVGPPPYATVVMIAEKAADMIKSDWLQ